MIGILAGVLSLKLVPVEDSVVFVSAVIIGSVLPDIDHHRSLLNRLVPVTRLVPRFFKHRGFFHSVFPAVILFAVFSSFGLLKYGIPIVIGYASHLLSDSFTRLGVNFLYPLTQFRIQGPITTGGLVESVVFVVVIIGIVLVVVW